MKLRNYFNELGRDEKVEFMLRVATYCKISLHTAKMYIYGSRSVPGKYAYRISHLTKGYVLPHELDDTIPKDIYKKSIPKTKK